MEPRRILVATSPANVPRGSQAPLVGVLPWSRTGYEWCSIIVKARVGRGAPDKLLPADTFLARPIQADPLRRPVDFVPAKSIIDVVVVGHVELPGPPGQAVRTSGALITGEERTLLQFEAPEAGRVPLTMRHARVQGEEGIDGALGPMNLHDGADLRFQYPDDFAFTLYQAACRPHLLREKLPESSKISLERIVNGRSESLLELEMPPFSPRIVVDPSTAGRRKSTVQAVLDTVLVDVDRAELELTWRGYYEVVAGTRDIDSIFLGWASEEEMATRRGWQNIFREMPHGHFAHAWFFKDADEGKAPAPLSPKQEKAARLRTWTFPLAPEPRLPIEKYAEISAELSAKREPRRQILARHGFDEPSWTLEERGWLERATGETRVYHGKSPTSASLVDARMIATERMKRQLPAAKEPS